MLKRRLKYNIIKFLRLKDAPGKLALGFAVGACVNFYPTFGFGVALAGLLAALCFSNVPAGLLGDIIFKPLFPLFFYLNLATGYRIWAHKVEKIHHLGRKLLHAKAATFAVVGKVFFTGALINSLVLGVIVYTCVFMIVKRYRITVLRWLVGKNRRK